MTPESSLPQLLFRSRMIFGPWFNRERLRGETRAGAGFSFSSR